MKLTLVALFIFSVVITSIAQENPGIYLSIACGRSIKKQRVLVGDKRVCLASQPIIAADEFSDISEVQRRNDVVYFDLTFSVKAQKMMKTLATELPTATFGLVVNKSVFAVFPAANLLVNRTFRFESHLDDHADFILVRDELKRLIRKRQLN